MPGSALDDWFLNNNAVLYDFYGNTDHLFDSSRKKKDIDSIARKTDFMSIHSFDDCGKPELFNDLAFDEDVFVSGITEIFDI